MAICSYNNKRLIPSPLVSISRNYQVSQDGTKLGAVFNLSIRGYMFSFNGSPDSDGIFYTGSFYNPDGRTQPTYYENLDEYNSVASIFRKQEAIRQLFSEDGHSLEFQAFDGSPPIKCNPRITSITFDEGVWFNKCNYTIECEADVLYINGQEYGEDDFEDKISSASESWSIETNEDADFESQNTYRLVHNIEARGKRFYDKDEQLEKEGWEQAKSYVLKRAGYDSTVVTASELDIDGLSRFNYVRGETVDKLDGSYSLTESWILAQASATEVFNVNVDKNGGEITVTVDGTINGFSVGDTIGGKINSAEDKWNTVQSQLYTRANTYSNLTLNTSPQEYSVSRNITTGVISYSYTYIYKPQIFTGTVAESINITQSFGIDSFAEVFVLGRGAGPVLQNLGTYESKKKTLEIAAIFPVTNVINYNNPFLTTNLAELTGIIEAVEPQGQVFISDNNFSWDAMTGQASFSRSWTYED